MLALFQAIQGFSKPNETEFLELVCWSSGCCTIRYAHKLEVTGSWMISDGGKEAKCIYFSRCVNKDGPCICNRVDVCTMKWEVDGPHARYHHGWSASCSTCLAISCLPSLSILQNDKKYILGDSVSTVIHEVFLSLRWLYCLYLWHDSLSP